MRNIVIVLFIFCFSAFAESADDEGLLEKINKKLADMQFLTVKFKQSYKESGTKKTQTGTIYFKQNEGLLVKYNEMPVAILINKNTITYFDSLLNQKSQIPTKDSAVKILTIKPEINKDFFEIKSVNELDEAIVVDLTAKEQRDDGDFTLYFSKNDFILRRLDIKSSDNEVFRMDLFSHDFSAIPKERFKAINIEKIYNK